MLNKQNPLFNAFLFSFLHTDNLWNTNKALAH